MAIGTIIKHKGRIGIISGEPQPTGKVPCWFGNEFRRETLAVNPSELVQVELIDLTPAENEVVLPLMQALVFKLVDDQIPF